MAKIYQLYFVPLIIQEMNVRVGSRQINLFVLANFEGLLQYFLSINIGSKMSINYKLRLYSRPNFHYLFIGLAKEMRCCSLIFVSKLPVCHFRDCLYETIHLDYGSH